MHTLPQLGEPVTVLFWDVDGTLLSTGRAGIFAFEEALMETRGVTLDLSALETSGLTDAEVASLVLETAGEPTDAATVTRLLRAYEERLPACLHRRRGGVMPGVREILDDLATHRSVRSILLTGNTSIGARAKLAHYGLGDFFPGPGAFCEGIGCREDIARAAFALVKREPNRQDRLYVIGDTPHDVRCGRAIGAQTVAVATGSHPVAALEAAGASHVLERLPSPAGFRTLLEIDR